MRSLYLDLNVFMCFFFFVLLFFAHIITVNLFFAFSFFLSLFFTIVYSRLATPHILGLERQRTLDNFFFSDNSIIQVLYHPNPLLWQILTR